MSVNLLTLAVPRWPYIALATLCCVLALATSASAECAWVLWTETIPPPGEPPSSTSSAWKPLSAWPGKMPCEAAMASDVNRAVKLYSSIPKWHATSNDLRGYAVAHPEGAWVVVYSCLPDTVDPRGPKGR